MNNLIISVPTRARNVFEEMDARESLIELSKNLSLANLKLLANKSKQSNINEKIQRYKKFL